MTASPRVAVIGAGIGGLTVAALLAKDGFQVTVVEANPYPGGCAATFTHKGYRFDAGATVAAGFHASGAHALVGRSLGLRWQARPKDPAWLAHLPDRQIRLSRDARDIARHFPKSAPFWAEQRKIADLTWAMSAEGLPFPPADLREALELARTSARFFPRNLRLLPLATASVGAWLRRHGLSGDQAFRRFIDAQLLISAQATSPFVNALYGATALDLPRQGVYQLGGGMGAISRELTRALQSLGGDVLYRQTVTSILVDKGLARGLRAQHGKPRGKRQGKRRGKEFFLPADLIIANSTPWSLHALLGPASTSQLRREIRQKPATQGAFVLHIGLRGDKLPDGLAAHHHIMRGYEGSLTEGNSLFLSISPAWDQSRAPPGYRAATVSTHTRVEHWWHASADSHAYQARKIAMAETMIKTIDDFIPGFKAAAELVLPGTPRTYQFYTQRQQGMVGGFPQTALWHARGPGTGIANLLLVGDSTFPGQSTVAVTLGALRVAKLAARKLQRLQF